MPTLHGLGFDVGSILLHYTSIILVHYFSLLAFILTPFYLFPTDISFVILKGSQGQVLYLFGLDHELPNEQEGANHIFVDKLLDVLRQNERKPNGGYHVLVQVSS